MRKTLKRSLSMILVTAVLMTSMLVSSVGAAETNPMQKLFLEVLSLGEPQKIEVADALHTLLDSGVGDDVVASAVTTICGIVHNISESDATKALKNYRALETKHKAYIYISILTIELNELSASDVSKFPNIAKQLNLKLTGSETEYKGVSLIIQLILEMDNLSKDSAWVTDVPTDTQKIAFEYNQSDAAIGLAKTQLDSLIDAMETIKAKISGRPESSNFDKLLGYAAEVINNADTSANKSEIKELKNYLKDINPNYYRPYNTSGGGGVIVAPTPSPTPSSEKGLEDAVEEIEKADPDNGAAFNDLKKQLESAIEKEIASVGTITVTPEISDNTATVTADQIKVADIIEKADAVIAKAAELEKTAGGFGAKVEKKVVIEVDSKDAANVNVALPAELLTKVQEKGIDKVEIASGDVKLDIAPDFTSAAKDAKAVSFEIKKVAVTAELKAKMSDEQKALLSSNSTVFDFNAALIAADGTETKVTQFDKAITIKVKYTLKAGESKDRITVLYLADDGSIQNMIGRYNELSGEVIFETKHFSSYVVKNLVKTFADVATGAWYKNQAETLASKGIAEGRAANKYVPEGIVTRAEFVTMLVKAKGVYDENAAVDFADVKKGEWFYTYVASAVKAGIASGMPDGTFAPNKQITREEMATMLANALGEKVVSSANKYLTASDADQISSYAKHAMALSVKNSFLVGNDNKLDPKGKATRGMAAVVVYKYFNFIY